jgi:hypothetical protein
MVILDPKAQNVKIAIDYKVVELSLKLDQIHIVDKIDLHRQTEEMVFRDVMQNSLSMNKLQSMADKIQK